MTTYGYRRDAAFRTEADGSKTDLFALDRKIGAFLASAPQVASGDVDLRDFCTETNQHQLSSCAGNATADAVEVLNALAGYKPVQLSRLFVYALARNLEPDPDDPSKTMLGRDEGSQIRLCFDVLSRYGICDEYLWPYDPALVFTSPSMKALRQAVGHRIHGYYRIDSVGAQRVADIISALRARHPVVFGTLIAKSFEGVGDDTPVGPPSGPTLGGHAMMIVGYIEGKGFIVKNSWGSAWGIDGFCFMAPEYLAWDQTTDLWVPTLGASFAP